MNISTIQLQKITASYGMVLTNGEVYGTEIYLGINDSVANWYEIPKYQYDEIMAEEERKARELSGETFS
jgi:hypothetical protein